MDKHFQEKTILTTGASSGIGRLTAFEFVSAYITVQVPNTQVLPVQLYVSDPNAVCGFVDALPAEFHDIDVLVNNAGLARGVDKAPSIKEDDLNVMFATNVAAPREHRNTM